MKAVCLLSGGKDSFLSAVMGLEQGMDIRYSLTVLPENDSMMFHVPNIRYAENAASILGLRTEFTEEQNFRNALEEAKGKEIECVISGAIASEYQKTRIERLCTEIGLVSFIPLWMKDQERIMEEIINSEIRAMIVSVSAEGLGIDYLGRYIDGGLIADLKEKSEKVPINISGEGGEYETFVTGYGGGKSIDITEKEIVWKGSAGILVIKKVSG